MKLRIIGMMVVLAGTFSSSAQATLLNFYFTIPAGNGVSQPISGEIFGLTDNAASTPGKIVITADAFNTHITKPYTMEAPGSLPNPYAATTNTIMVTHGEITGASLEWYTTSAPYSDSVNLNFYLNGDGGVNGERDDLFGPSSSSNLNSLGFVSSYYRTAAVPEPGQWGLFVFLAMAAGIAWKRFSSRPLRKA